MESTDIKSEHPGMPAPGEGGRHGMHQRISNLKQKKKWLRLLCASPDQTRVCSCAPPIGVGVQGAQAAEWRAAQGARACAGAREACCGCAGRGWWRWARAAPCT